MQHFLCFLCALCVLCVPAFAQTADPFTAYHAALNYAADATLEEAQRSELRPRRDVASYVSTAAAFSVVKNPVPSSLARVQQLRPMLEPILREEGVPTEMAAVVLVESGGRSTALSSKGALGLWQLMPDTARRYGLKVTASEDERLDPVKGTRAAARHLRDLYSQFGDWKLAFAAYNAGEQTVHRAVQRAGSSDFLRVSALLPVETRTYVPAVTSALSLFGGVRWIAAPRTQRTGRVLYAATQISAGQ